MSWYRDGLIWRFDGDLDAEYDLDWPETLISEAGHRLAPCGTESARRRHKRRGEVCAECEASVAREIKHGTNAGARMHRRHGEKPCFDCRRAEAAARADHYAASRGECVGCGVVRSLKARELCSSCWKATREREKEESA